MAGFNKGERGVKCFTVKNIDEMRFFFQTFMTLIRIDRLMVHWPPLVMRCVTSVEKCLTGPLAI